SVVPEARASSPTVLPAQGALVGPAVTPSSLVSAAPAAAVAVSVPVKPQRCR
ncbi:hypothetical protein NJB1907f34b_04140, partial [Mycobacterium marinum]